MRSASKLSLLLLFLSRVGSAEPVVVHVAPAHRDATNVAGTLRVFAGPAGAREVPFQAGVDTPVDLPLVPARVEVVAPGYWSPGGLLPNAETRRLVLPLWPAGEIRGKLAAERGLDLPKQLSARVTLLSEDGMGAGLTATVPCTIALPEFTCIVPAAPLDLKLEAPDVVPHYFWRLPVERACGHSVGTLHLRRGASVAGWVAIAGPGAFPPDVMVALKPVAHADGEREANARSPEVPATDRGFFQFRGVPDGRYTLVASSRGWSPATSEELTVDASREYEQRAPLTLSPLRNLHVTVQPPRSPGGGAWVLKLDRAVPLSNYYRAVASEPADESGAWVREGLEGGHYRLLVTDRQGSVFARRTIELTRDEVIAVEVAAVAVRGAVTLGEHPLEAELLFSDRSGKAVRIGSDAEGRFTGALPNEGTWSVRVAPAGRAARIDGKTVHVRRSDGDDFAVVDIRLPGGTVRGRVLDEQGRGVVADVAAFHGGRVAGQAATDASGHFQIIGLPPGEFRLQAEAAERNGDAVPVSAVADGPDVRILVRQSRATSARLTDDRGDPVAGALLRYALPDGVVQREAVSGPSGEIELNLPPGTDGNVVVLAPGFPAKLIAVRVPGSPNDRLDIVLSRTSGTLTIRLGSTPPWPYLHRGNAAAPLPSLFAPTLGGPPPGLGGVGFTLSVEPGTYRVCAGPRAGDGCAVTTVHAGGHATVDARGVHGSL